MNWKNYALVSCILLAAVSMTGEELFPSGNFEGQSIKPLGIVRRLPSKADKAAFKDGFTWKLQTEKVFSGKQALLLEEKKEGCNLELNLSIPCEAGKEYEFSFRYFIESSADALKVSSRIALLTPGKKPRYLFPKGTVKKGEWLQFKTKFKAAEGNNTAAISIWFSDTPCKVFVDDISVTTVEPQK